MDTIYMNDYILSKRPTLSKSSVVTYASILRNLYKKVFNDDLDFKRFDETEPILTYLNDVEPKKRKTILSALVVITNNQAYRTLMMNDIQVYQKESENQEKGQEWVTPTEIQTLWNDLKKDADLLYKKKVLNPVDFQTIQSYIILSLLGGIFIPPRRSKDFVDFKITDIDKDKDNYVEKNKMIFNSYKTFKTYGRQTVDIPKPLVSILKKWLSINPTPYLLFDSHNQPLSSVKLNQRLNKMFDKKVGVNALRHTYLTDKYSDMKSTTEMMGTSVAMIPLYVKT